MADRPARRPRRPTRSATIEQLLAAKEIVITLRLGRRRQDHRGGRARRDGRASHLGGKVLVLTVDPARRLATALGLEAFGNVETPVPAEAFADGRARSPRASCGRPCSTPSSRWDDLVRRHAPDAKTRDAILANPLYQNITGRFVQSHDYIAMERLYEIHASGRYDLIVVDTPPDPQRPRLPRRAGAHGRLLHQPAAALADRRRTAAGS